MRTPSVLVLADGEGLGPQVDRVMSELRPRPRVRLCATWAAAQEAMAAEPPFDVLVAGPVGASADAGLDRLRRLRTEAPQTQVVLALRPGRDLDLRGTVRAGACDIVWLPAADDALLEAIEHAIEASAAVSAGSRSDPAADAGRLAPGRVIAVMSGSGGAGKTFVSTNLAYRLHCQAGASTCLIDLDLQFGEVAASLRMRPRLTIVDLLGSEAPGGDVGRHLRDHLARHESGILLLPAPEQPNQADNIEAVEIDRVIDAARSEFDYVVVDTPTALTEPVLVAVAHADHIFALANLNLPSVRNLGVLLSTLSRLKVPGERVTRLLNKVEPDVGIEAERMAQYFPGGFGAVIPYGREVTKSLNLGQPLLAYAPGTEVGRALSAGLDASPIVPPGPPVEEAAAPRRRRWAPTSRKSR